MKSIIIALVSTVLLLSNVVSAQKMWALTTAQATAVGTSCKNELANNSAALAANVNYQTLFYVPSGGLTTVCSEALPSEAELSGGELSVASKCWKLQNIGSSIAWKLDNGYSQKWCPLSFGSTCDPTNEAKRYCQTKDRQGKECNVADDNSICLYPTPQHVLLSYAQFPYHYKSRSTPLSISQALQNAVQAHCPIYSQSDYSYPAEKGRVIILGFALMVPKERCDVVKLQEQVEAAIAVWNASAPKEETYDVSGDYSVIDAPVDCFDHKTGGFNCKEVSGCSLPCGEGIVCENDPKICGDKCILPPDGTVKVCFSIAIGHFVMPILLSLLLITLF